jgi:dipeptidyl aminopeptidase/acylaminoacyl peptidase
MTTNVDLDRQLRAHFESTADRTVRDGQIAWVLEEVRRRPQRPGWLAGLRSPRMSAETLALNPVAGRRALAPILVAGLILLLVLAAVFAAGAGPFKSNPTNGRIVFGRYDAAQKDTVLYTVNPDGTHLIKLQDQALECPRFSPDGSRITVTSADMKPDGTDFRQMTGAASDDKTLVIGNVTLGCGVWAPDGRHLAAEGWSDADPTLNGIYSFRASDGSDLQRVTTAPTGHDIPIGYSPDGKTLAFTGDLGIEGVDGGGLFLINADGTNRHRVGDLTIVSGDWAPDGGSILAATTTLLYSIDIATGRATRVPATGDSLGNPQWSPDGTRILFNRAVGNQTEFFTMLADGTDVVRVTNDPDDDYFADWGTAPLIR